MYKSVCVRKNTYWSKTEPVLINIWLEAKKLKMWPVLLRGIELVRLYPCNIKQNQQCYLRTFCQYKAAKQHILWRPEAQASLASIKGRLWSKKYIKCKNKRTWNRNSNEQDQNGREMVHEHKQDQLCPLL